MLCLRKSPKAFLPERAGPEEVGFDITLIEKVKEIDPYTIMYDTGIAVQPPDGWYTQVVPRSSIVKTGWFLANSIGIIDPTYRDTIKVVLKRVDKDTKEITLPAKTCQLLLQPVYRILKEGFTEEVIEVNSLSLTTRKGGFGSTDKGGVEETKGF